MKNMLEKKGFVNMIVNFMLKVLMFICIGLNFSACGDSSPQAEEKKIEEKQIAEKEEAKTELAETKTDGSKERGQIKEADSESTEHITVITPAPESKANTDSVDFAPMQRDLSIADDDMVVGNPNAKVVVVEYYSPTCAHCRTYHKWTFPLLKDKYMDTGLVAYVIREFIGNKQDLDAALLMRCNGQKDTYLKFHKILLQKQSQWAYNRNFRDILTNIGGVGGVEPEEYANCLKSQDKINVLMANTKLIYDMPQFGGTPSFFIQGQRHKKPYSFEELSKAIDAALAKENINIESAIKLYEQESATSQEDTSKQARAEEQTKEAAKK